MAKITPIKGKPKNGFQISDTKLPPALAAARPTAASLAKHAYQKKVAAAFAPKLILKTLQALESLVEAGNMQAVTKVLEMFEFIQRTGGVSIINNNNVDARTANVDARSEVRSFERVQRMLNEDREKRQIAVSQGLAPIHIAGFAETPEGLSGGSDLE